MGVRKTEETVVNGVREVKRVPNVPNMSIEHPLYIPPVSKLGQAPSLLKERKK